MADFRIRVIIDPSKARRGARQVERSLDRVGARADRTGYLIARAFAFVGVALAVRQLAILSDSFIEMNNRIAVAEETIGNTNGVLERMFEIANRVRQPVSELVRLFSRAALVSNELGASQEDLLLFTEAVGKGFAIQGSSSQKNADAILQLSQALGSAVVRGEEFNSILEGGLPIAQAAARGIERFGGSVARLRLAVVAGEVSSQEFFQAILSQADELDRTFQRTVPTIGQSLSILRNNLIQSVGAFNESTGAAEAVSRSIIGLSKYIDRLIQLLAVVIIAIGSRYVTAAVLSAAGSLRAAAAATVLQVSLARMDGISRRAAIGMIAVSRAGVVLRAGVGLLGGPLGVITLAAFAVYAFTEANRDARRDLVGITDDIDAYRESIVLLTRAQLANRNQNLIDRISERESELEFINTQIDRARSQNERTISQLPPGSELGRQLAASLRRDIQGLEAERDTLIQSIEADAERLRAGFDIELGGSTDSSTPALAQTAVDTSEIDALREALIDLQNSLDPILSAQREYAASVDIINRAVGEGLINLQQRNKLIEGLGEGYRDQLDPLRAQTEALEEEIRLYGLSASERRIQIEILEIEQNLRESGVRITEEQSRALEAQIRTLDALANAEEEVNGGIRDRNALLSAEIRILNQEAEVARQTGDEKVASDARSNIETKIRNELRDADRYLTEEQINVLGRLSVAEEEAINRAVRRNQELRREAEAFEEIRGPVRTYEENLEALIALYGRGRISAEEFDHAQRELEITFLESTFSLEAGFQRGILRVEDDFTNFARVSESAVVGAFQGMEDALTAFRETGELQFGALVDSIISDLQRILIRSAILGPLTQALSGALGGVFGGTNAPLSLPVQLPPSAPALGLAGGGLASGPGSGRSDSILARISTGEYVVNSSSTKQYLPLLKAINSAPRFQNGGEVSPSGGGRKGLVEIYVVDQRSSGEKVEVNRSRGSDGGELITVMIRDAVESNLRNGQHDGAMRGRYGVRPSISSR